MTMIMYIHIQQTLRFNSSSSSKTVCMGLVYLSAIFLSIFLYTSTFDEFFITFYKVTGFCCFVDQLNPWKSMMYLSRFWKAAKIAKPKKKKKNTFPNSLRWKQLTSQVYILFQKAAKRYSKATILAFIDKSSSWLIWSLCQHIFILSLAGYQAKVQNPCLLMIMHSSVITLKQSNEGHGPWGEKKEMK